MRCLTKAFLRIGGSLENYLLTINLVLQPHNEAGGFLPENIAIGTREVAILLSQAGNEANEIYSPF